MLCTNYNVRYGEEDPYELLEKEKRISSKKRGYNGQTLKMQNSLGLINVVNYDVYLMYQYKRDNFYCTQDRQVAVESNANHTKEQNKTATSNETCYLSQENKTCKKRSRMRYNERMPEQNPAQRFAQRFQRT